MKYDSFYSWKGYKTLAGKDFLTIEGALDWARKQGEAPYFVKEKMINNIGEETYQKEIYFEK